MRLTCRAGRLHFAPLLDRRPADEPTAGLPIQPILDDGIPGPPVWLAEGIPATEKGRTLGLELVEPPIAVERTAENPAGGSR